MTTLQPPTIPRITHRTAAEVATAAYDQLLDLLDRLEPHHWSAPTDCTGWDVAAIAGHLIGAGKGNASLLEGVRQQVRGVRHASAFDGNALDAVNGRQVADHADLTPAERVAALRAVAPRAVRGRTRLPRPVRAIRIPLGLDSGSALPGTQRSMSLGQLMEVVYTRDIWLHTVDIERATGVPADRGGDVDRRIIADAVADWLGLHRQPVYLHLTGPAGGAYTQGEGGPRITVDAIEWARTVSGRERGEGLLAQP
ncbi:MAG TPA: maleylpyruvate isomerase family mycothiol-dependent enzyme, partial [Euzebya sp.]|nr:maleylpyruvate isomerase family mycothiol-dependent enzyme [Euzebya sp.]